MPIQTTYDFKHGVGQEGLRFGVGPSEIISCYSEVDIYPGRAVSFTDTYAQDGSGRPRIIHPNDTGLTLAGVVVYARDEEMYGELDGLSVLNTTQEMYYRAGTPIPVMIKGVLYVYAEQAVNPTSAVFTRTESKGGNTILGRFRTDADGSEPATAIAVPGARFTEARANAGLVPLRINMPTA